MSGYGLGGASRDSNVLKMWDPVWLSAGSDIDLNYRLLKNRAADLARNSPIGQAAITTSARGVIGAGLKLFARPNHRVLGISPEEARQWSRQVGDEFRLWASTVECDNARRNNFFDLQHIAYVSYLTDGDVFCLFRRKPPTPRNPYTLRLQLLEAGRVSTPTLNVTSSTVEGRASNGNRIINGVEVDPDGALTAFYVSNRVPNDLVGRDEVTEWVRVRAFGERSGFPNIVQIAHDERAGQYRGIPYLAPVIETLKQVSRFTNAELASAIVRSFFSLFFVQPLQNYGIDEALGQKNTPTPELDLAEFKLGSGTLNALPRGMDVKSVDSGHSTSVFKPFTEALITQIGSALSIPKEVLLCSFNASYSASRAALLQAADEFKRRREWFVRDFVRPVYEAWLTEAVAIGRVTAPGYFDNALKRSAWSEASWYGPSFTSLDPLKEIQAAILRMEFGLSTKEKEAAEITGTDYEENVEQLMIEEMMRHGDSVERGDNGGDDGAVR